MLVIVIFHLNIRYSFLSHLFPFHLPSHSSVSLCFPCWKKPSWIQNSSLDSVFKDISNAKWDCWTVNCTFFFPSRDRKLAMLLSFQEPISQEKVVSKLPSSIFFYMLSILLLCRALGAFPYPMWIRTLILKNTWNIISKEWEVDIYHTTTTGVH